MLFRIFLLILLPSIAWSYQTAINNSGQDVFWANKNIPLTLTNSTNDLSGIQVNTILQDAISSWNNSSSAKLSLTSSAPSEIKFVQDFSIYGSAVIGLTELSYNKSGSIIKASILLNDEYQFKSEPGFYFGKQVYLGDVIGHEFGHLLGLSHSEILNSTMFYANFPGQQSLSLDDKAGIREKYDGGLGTISGYVKGGNHIGVFGVHVQAFSLKTGESVGVVSKEDGRFEINGLDLDDKYYIYTSPLKNLSALPQEFSAIQNNFCPGSFKGSFFQACGKESEGLPQGIALSQSVRAIDIGTVSINCSLKVSEDYSLEKVQSVFTPITIMDYSEDGKKSKAFVGHFLSSTTVSWSNPDLLTVDLRSYSALSGNQFLRVKLVANAFGNQLKYFLSVKKNGIDQPGLTQELSYSNVLKTYNNDLSVDIPLGVDSSQNIFELSLKAMRLDALVTVQTYPSSELFSTSEEFPYLMLLAIGSNTSLPVDTELNLSDNDSCLDAPFTYAVTKARLVDEIETSKASNAAAVASCGSIEPPDDGSGNGGQFLGVLALGFLLSSLLSKWKRSKNFLS